MVRQQKNTDSYKYWLTRWHGDIVRGPTIKFQHMNTVAESSKQNSSQSYLKMVQKLPAKLPRNLVPNPDGQPRVDPVTVDPQNRGRNRNRMNEAENNETKFQQKLHFSKNFFLSFLTSTLKICDKFYFLTILFILSSFNFDQKCFQAVVFETIEVTFVTFSTALVFIVEQDNIYSQQFRHR